MLNLKVSKGSKKDLSITISDSDDEIVQTLSSTDEEEEVLNKKTKGNLLLNAEEI
jgi:hypothetical protein